MVISHKYKYIFIELPRTGTTAITDQLLKFYNGERILIKHASYRNLKKFYGNKYDDYFVFSSIRNPMERTISIYQKLRNGSFKPKSKFFFGRRIKFVKKNSSFEDYFLKFHKLPYDDWSSLDHHNFDHLIRFESLQADFKIVLKKLGITQIQEIPVINKTKKKKNFTDYFTPKIQGRATKVFSPHCDKFGYEIPWKKENTNTYYLLLYRCLFYVKKILWIQQTNFIIRKKIKSDKIKTIEA